MTVAILRLISNRDDDLDHCGKYFEFATDQTKHLACEEFHKRWHRYQRGHDRVRRVDVSQRREMTQEMYRSSGGFELALAPALMGLLGYLIDRSIGATPVVTVALAVLGLVGVCVKLYFGYKAEMEIHEANAPWARNR